MRVILPRTPIPIVVVLLVFVLAVFLTAFGVTSALAHTAETDHLHTTSHLHLLHLVGHDHVGLTVHHDNLWLLHHVGHGDESFTSHLEPTFELVILALLAFFALALFLGSLALLTARAAGSEIISAKRNASGLGDITSGPFGLFVFVLRFVECEFDLGLVLE